MAPAPAGPPSRRSGEEAAQLLRGSFRHFLGKEMTGIEWSAADIVCPGTPQRKRTAPLCEPTAERTSTTPKHENRTGYPPSGSAILQIMLVIESRRGAILLADGMNVSGIPKCRDIRRPHFGAERICRRAPPAERVIDDGIRRG